MLKKQESQELMFQEILNHDCNYFVSMTAGSKFHDHPKPQLVHRKATQLFTNLCVQTVLRKEINMVCITSRKLDTYICPE